MNLKLLKYQKTPRFEEVVKNIRHHAHFVGMDEEGNPMYDTTVRKPAIQFTGTVKLHGTNASICWSPDTGLYCQSRNRIVGSPKNKVGHNGFVEYVFMHESEVTDMMIKLYEENKVEDTDILCVYGEWCGPGIQKGVAISEIPNKSYFIFGVKIRSVEEEESRWMSLIDYEIPLIDKIPNFYQIQNFLTYGVEIDFENPGLAVKTLIEITNQVEQECPVAKHFGISGIGEGLVWEGIFKENRYIFKTKGEKHSSSKVSKIVSISPEKLKSILGFVEYAATENRVDQAIKEVQQALDKTELYKPDTPHVLRWIANDIISEEADVLKESNLDWKDVAKQVSDKARRIFFDKIEKFKV